MIGFIIKGLLRDKHRSFFPILIVISGALLTVLLQSWMSGAFASIINTNAAFDTGNVKVMSRAYRELADQFPNDLVMLNTSGLQKDLQRQYPTMYWTPRIRFGGLLDVPDKEGETRAQGPLFCLAVDLFSVQSKETELLNLKKALISGRLPESQSEALLTEDYAHKLQIRLGEEVTLISSTVDGAMAMYNFTVVGTIRFEIMAMDRGVMVMDISAARYALNMEEGASEIVGFYHNMLYNDAQVKQYSDVFNRQAVDANDPFSPVMIPLSDQNDLGTMLKLSRYIGSIIVTVFVVAMSLVLWNAGLMGSLRRYGEIGVRLAIGESKRHVYISLILESVVISFVGSVIGTTIGVLLGLYLEKVGIDISHFMRNTGAIMTNVIRADVTGTSYAIGFIPGFIASVLGTMFAGIGIFKRQTAQLFKELEV